MKTAVYSWIIYPIGICIAQCIGVFNAKVRESLRLRAWKDFLSLRLNRDLPIEYWIHVASQGELEYAIPILKSLQKNKKQVLVTYYSISAKDAVENLPNIFSNVSLVVPLPHDGLGLMKEFVRLVHGQGVRFLLLLKYELWPGLLWECNSNHIKVILVDALKPSWFHQKLLHKLDAILVGYVSEVVNHKNLKIIGDTRVERVLERLTYNQSSIHQFFSNSIQEYLKQKPVLVCGSMWSQDTKLIAQAMKHMRNRPNDTFPFHLIWIPHELDRTHETFAARKFLSLGFQVCQNTDKDLSAKPLAIIVMKKGILAELYQFGDFAFVGGGFGAGVHSVWEPAIAGCWVGCGPRTQRSPEVFELEKHGFLSRLTHVYDGVAWFNKMTSQRKQDVTRRSYLFEEILKPHFGASDRVIEFCEKG